MIKLFLRYLFVSLLFVSGYSPAQTQEIKFNLINGMNGIFLGKINSITQDKEGAMWFSDQTNRCITRYDGNRMIRYQHNPKDPNTLGGYYPECVNVDSNGIIWIGFFGFGLDMFDPVTGTFTHFRHDPNNPASIANDTISNVLIDHQNQIWIGSNGGLSLFDPAKGTFTHFAHDPANPKSLSYNKVRALYEDHEGTLWVGTGFPWDRNDLGGLNRFDRNAGTFTRYLHDPKDKNSLINNKVRAIFEDSRGILWIGTMGDGLHSLDLANGIITRHTYDAKHPEEISRPPLKTAEDHITFITEDATKSLWIGTYSNGLVRYNPQTKVSTHYTGSNSTGIGYKDQSGWVAFVSTGGWLWISTQESNLYKIDLFNTRVDLNMTLGYTSYSLLEKNKEIQWFAANDGLYRKNLTTGISRQFRNDPQNPKSISGNWQTRIYEDPEGVIWISTPAGLNRFEEKTQTFTRYVMNANDTSSLAWNDISVLLTDSKSNFWVGTYGGGIHLMNKEKGTFRRFKSVDGDSTSLSGDFVTAVLEGDSNDLWIGTWDTKGINRMNYVTKKCRRYLPGTSISAILKDSDGTIWVGTNNNIYSYDDRTDTFTLYTVGGVPVVVNDMKSMILDKEDNLWIFSVTGVIRINPKKEQYIVYGKQNGFISEDYPYSSANLLITGEIIAGTWTGYHSFDPAKFVIPPGRPVLSLSNLYINGQLIKPGLNNSLPHPLDDTKEIRLSYNQNVFSFSFQSIDYSPEESKLFYYKLENFDKEWQVADPNGQLYYFNIPPGKYILKIIAINTMNGSQVEKDITMIIAPPWWKTWWAYLLYGIGTIALGLSIHRYLKAQVLKTERERNRAHELAQAKEIEKAYHELKNTQAQLIQSEKMASLGELTAGIAHEIQNPLNFINNFADVNAELIDEMNQGIEKGDMAEVKSISYNIKENEQKIIFHGKRADSIVKGMLQHSRASSGTKEPTDINALADEYLRLAYHGLRAKDKSFNATMKTDFDENIGLVNVIPQDIGRVILNLITNAFYVVDEKKRQHPLDYEPTVTVRTKKMSDHVVVSVRDNGPGISPHVMEKIFQPFFTTKPTGQGTGLGLSLSYDIVKAHGGELKVETVEGEGTTFIIQLPHV